MHRIIARGISQQSRHISQAVTVIVINPAGRQGGSRPCYRSDPASPAAALLVFHSLSALSLCIAYPNRRFGLFTRTDFGDKTDGLH